MKRITIIIICIIICIIACLFLYVFVYYKYFSNLIATCLNLDETTKSIIDTIVGVLSAFFSILIFSWLDKLKTIINTLLCDIDSSDPITWKNDVFAYMTIEIRFKDNFQKSNLHLDIGSSNFKDEYSYFINQTDLDEE